jgi:hypothetical protein
MHNSSCLKKTRRAQSAVLVLLAISLLFETGCSSLFGKLASKEVGVPPVLTPLVEAESSQLIAEVNRLATVKSIHAKLDIQFQDTSFASSGIAEKYRSADANVTVQRPGKVYLVIQFLLADIARMTSDGEHFRVAVLKGDEKYRRFVKGTNNAIYGELKANGSANTPNKSQSIKAERVTVSALSNLRPQHLTDALLIQPIPQPLAANFFYAKSEFFEEEPDSRPQAKKGARVVRGYYLLEELVQTAPGEARLRRRFWFDRVGAIRLARLQTFDERGLLDTDVSYSGERTLGQETTVRLPSHIELTRPKDQYKLSLTYQAPESVTIDREYEPAVFVLENTTGLPEVDLDAQKNTRATTPP